MKELTGFLEHMLKSASGTVTGANQVNRGTGIGGFLNSDFGRGGLAGGALGMMLGKNKKARKLAGYGGLAALGMMVYETYSQYQKQQQQQALAPQSAASHAQPAQISATPTPAAPWQFAAASAAPQTVDRLSGEQADAHGVAILSALIAAAKSDGHIDERERQTIMGEFTRLGLGDQAQQWLHAEFNKPLDPAEVARAARTPEMAGEMYLASLLIIDEQSFMERAYLQELGRQLQLPEAVQQQLAAQLQRMQASAV